MPHVYRPRSLVAEQGFSIEVGWVEVDEDEDNRLRGEAQLIRPTDEWLQNFVWDRGAQAVHGIGLNLLQEMGLAPLDVVQMLERGLGDAVVFTDNPIADGHWLRLLYAAADRPMRLKLADVELAYDVFRKQESPGGYVPLALIYKNIMLEKWKCLAEFKV